MVLTWFARAGNRGATVGQPVNLEAGGLFVEWSPNGDMGNVVIPTIK